MEEIIFSPATSSLSDIPLSSIISFIVCILSPASLSTSGSKAKKSAVGKESEEEKKDRDEFNVSMISLLMHVLLVLHSLSTTHSSKNLYVKDICKSLPLFLSITSSQSKEEENEEFDSLHAIHTMLENIRHSITDSVSLKAVVKLHTQIQKSISKKVTWNSAKQVNNRVTLEAEGSEDG